MAALVICLIIGSYLFYKLVYKSIVRVRHSEVMIIERCGRFKEVLRPGIYWIWPIIDSARVINWRYVDASSGSPQVVSISTTRVDMREHLIDLGNQTVITKDTVQLELDALVYFRIQDPLRAVYQVQNLPDAIELLTQSSLRNIVAGLTLDDSFSSRELINAELLSKVQRDCERWGVLITRVEIQNILPPSDILDAMTKQITAERERRSDVLRADGERESSIIESRGQAAKVVLEAEAVRASTVLRAKGAAEAKKVMASAEAQCLEDIRAAVAPFRVRGVDYLTSVEYLNSLARLTSGPSTRENQSKVVLVPVDTVDVMGTVLNLAGRTAESVGRAMVGGLVR